MQAADVRGGGRVLVAGAAIVAVLLVAGYAALGGGRFRPTAAGDPCAARWPSSPARDADEAGQRIARLALSRAACSLGTTREDLLLALSGRDALRALEAREGLPEGRVEQAVRKGLTEALDEGVRRRAIQPGLATVIGQAAAVLPLDRVVRTIDGTARPCEPLAWQRVASDDAVLAEVVVQGLVRASCALGAPALDVITALVQPDGVAALARSTGRAPDAVEGAVRDALRGGIRDAVGAGDLDADVGTALDALVEAAPVAQALAVLRGDRSSCDAIPWRGELSSMTQIAAQVGLRAIAQTSCRLDAPVADVAAAIAQPDGLAGLAASRGLDPAAVEGAARDGLRAGLKDAEANGAVTGVLATALDAAVEVVPVDRLLATLRGDEDPCQDIPWRKADGATQVGAEIALLGVSRAACTLGTSTAALAGALASDAALDAYAGGVPGGRDAVDRALRDGLRDAVGKAQDGGDLNTVTAFLLRELVGNAPLLDVVGAVRDRLG